jgi:hypothetical protein
MRADARIEVLTIDMAAQAFIEGGVPTMGSVRVEEELLRYLLLRGTILRVAALIQS